MIDSEGSVERWETREARQIADCRVFTVHEIQRRSRSTGKHGNFFCIEARDWVNVIAVTEAGQVLLVRQYRHGTDEVTLEIPSGIIDGDETPADAARRELLEETGYACEAIVEIGCVRPNPAIMNNRAYTFLATGLSLRGAQTLDDHEEIEIVHAPLDHIDTLLREGAIDHSLMIAAFHFYSLRERTASPAIGDAHR